LYEKVGGEISNGRLFQQVVWVHVSMFDPRLNKMAITKARILSESNDKDMIV